MNIYKSLNELIKYIEENLETNLDTKKMAQIVGVNPQILQSLFSLLTNIGLSEYIRNRKFTKALEDLQSGESLMEVATKYGYNSSVAFSRSFTKFHGIKPSEVKKKKQKGKNYPILHFDEEKESLLDMSYRIERRKTFTLYGVKKEMNLDEISYYIPKFFRETQEKYKSLCGNISYGMVSYKNREKSERLEYWCLYNQPQKDFEKVIFPSSKWLVFKIQKSNSRKIQNLANKFYSNFLPSNNFELRELPELEVYLEDGSMEFMVAIE